MSKEIEEWRDIEGFDGYQISNYGRVKSLNYNKTKQEKILKPQKSTKGYLTVGLNKNGKQVRKQIHRLVAEAFLENPNNLPQVNHKDEDKSSNIVSNLEWCDSKYNNNYGTRTERCSRRVDQIDMVSGEVIRQWASTQECGRNGYDYSAVAHCARGELKQYKGYIWKYVTEIIT